MRPCQPKGQRAGARARASLRPEVPPVLLGLGTLPGGGAKQDGKFRAWQVLQVWALPNLHHGTLGTTHPRAQGPGADLTDPGSHSCPPHQAHGQVVCPFHAVRLPQAPCAPRCPHLCHEAASHAAGSVVGADLSLQGRIQLGSGRWQRCPVRCPFPASTPHQNQPLISDPVRVKVSSKR